LKNALDHLYREWRDKPVAFVGYGLDGGTRAVEHLRAIAAELGMAAVGPQVAISLRADYADGRLEPRSFQAEARQRMHPRRIAARNIHPQRLGWHARDIAVEKAGQ
jgi:NAD(P)H-dependent FMN reductase